MPSGVNSSDAYPPPIQRARSSGVNTATDDAQCETTAATQHEPGSNGLFLRPLDAQVENGPARHPSGAPHAGFFPRPSQ